MLIEKIQENIRKNEEKLQKAETLLQKRIAKCDEHFAWFKKNNIQPTWEDCCRVRDTENRYDQFDHYYYIEYWFKDENGNQRHYAELKIRDIKKALETWKERLVKENLIQNRIENLPESLKTMSEYLNQLWFEYEINRRESIKELIKETPFEKFIKIYGYNDYRHAHKSDEEIKKEVEIDVKYSILDLLNRVSEVAGEIKSWENIRWNGKALNGTVEGSKGNARIETITAGGYRIQRFHYRVLVHKF